MSDVTARESILRLVRAALPNAVPAPEVAATVREFSRPAGDAPTRFAVAAGAAGARVVEGVLSDLSRLVPELAPNATRILSVVRELPGTVAAATEPHAFADLDLLVCRAVLGVAENGAVWIPESRVGTRSALFLATTVIVVLDREAIVSDLHAAYEQLDLRAESFGILVAGPSKTADIEQALVIGAHGPKQLTIILVGT